MKNNESFSILSDEACAKILNKIGLLSLHSSTVNDALELLREWKENNDLSLKIDGIFYCIYMYVCKISLWLTLHI